MNTTKQDNAVKTPPIDPILNAQVAVGYIEYTDIKRNPQRLYFQTNPTSMTRSRTVERVDSRAGNPAEGTTTKAGSVGRKFSHKAAPWRFEALEIWFDASLPYTTSGSVRAEGAVGHKQNLLAIEAAIKYIETISEPGPVSTQNDSQTNAPPAPSPPLITLVLGKRHWQGHVQSVTIVEKDFTPDLVPRQLKVTLGLELMLPYEKIEQGKTGGML